VAPAVEPVAGRNGCAVAGFTADSRAVVAVEKGAIVVVEVLTGRVRATWEASRDVVVPERKPGMVGSTGNQGPALSAAGKPPARFTLRGSLLRIRSDGCQLSLA